MPQTITGSITNTITISNYEWSGYVQFNPSHLIFIDEVTRLIVNDPYLLVGAM